MRRLVLSVSIAVSLVVVTAAGQTAGPVAASAQNAEPIRYVLRFPAPQTHYVEVEATYPAAGPQVDLFMAVWTPGSYLVREYERHVENLMLRDRGTGAVVKTAKNRWRVTPAAGAKSVTLTYRVYGREMTVRNNWIDDGFAMINGAPTFISMVG